MYPYKPVKYKNKNLFELQFNMLIQLLLQKKQ